MKKIGSSNRATLCTGNTCVTVYGKTAEIVQTVVVVLTIAAFASALTKLLR